MDQQTNDLIKSEIENNEICLVYERNTRCATMRIFNG